MTTAPSTGSSDAVSLARLDAALSAELDALALADPDMVSWLPGEDESDGKDDDDHDSDSYDEDDEDDDDHEPADANANPNLPSDLYPDLSPETNPPPAAAVGISSFSHALEPAPAPGRSHGRHRRLTFAEWHAAYTRCQRHFVEKAQFASSVRQLAAFVEMLLPGLGPGARLGPGDTSVSSSSSSSSSSSAAALDISLTPYLRRLIATGFDTAVVARALFGPSAPAGVGPLLARERRNYLFAAKSEGWGAVKRTYDGGGVSYCCCGGGNGGAGGTAGAAGGADRAADGGSGGSDGGGGRSRGGLFGITPAVSAVSAVPLAFGPAPFLRPLQRVGEAEIRTAEECWSGWMAHEDWMLGPRAPRGMGM